MADLERKRWWDEVVRVPLGAPRLGVRVIALRKSVDPGEFEYLQGMKSGHLKRVNPDPEQTECSKKYDRNKQDHFRRLADAVPSSSDAILSPPSRRAGLIEPYRRAIATRHPGAIDLTGAVSRQGEVCAGEGATHDDLRASLSYNPCGREANFRRGVIVDDIFNTGSTAAAIATLLRDHGVAEGCEIIFACPLWLERKTGPSLSEVVRSIFQSREK